MKTRYLGIAMAMPLLAMAGAANAAVILETENGSAVYTGPVPTYDFDTPATTPPTTDGIVKTGSSGNGAQPLGSTGFYYSVGPSTNSPGLIDLSAFGGAIGQLSFIWGSVDTYNTLDILGLDNSVIATFTGQDIIDSQFGNQTLPQSNPLVTLTFTGGDQFNVGALRLTSTQEAFEIDNIAVQAAVPEPATWLLLIFGFAAVGGMMRRKPRIQEARVRYV